MNNIDIIRIMLIVCLCMITSPYTIVGFCLVLIPVTYAYKYLNYTSRLEIDLTISVSYSILYILKCKGLFIEPVFPLFIIVCNLFISMYTFYSNTINECNKAIFINYIIYLSKRRSLFGYMLFVKCMLLYLFCWFIGDSVLDAIEIKVFGGMVCLVCLVLYIVIINIILSFAFRKRIKMLEGNNDGE